MRLFVVLAGLGWVLLSARCGHKEAIEDAAELNSSGRLPQTLHEEQSGRTAEKWNHDLLGPDEHLSQIAAFALQEIGEESLRFVLAAFFPILAPSFGSDQCPSLTTAVLAPSTQGRVSLRS